MPSEKDSMSECSSSLVLRHEIMSMRTGVLGEGDASEDEVQTMMTAAALLRTFAKDACDVAARYACAHRRREVTGSDMRSALMYCARTFFEQDDATLSTRIDAEMAIMKDESSNEGDSDEGDSDKGDGDEGDRDEGDRDEGESDKGESDKGDSDKGESGGRKEKGEENNAVVGAHDGPQDSLFVKKVELIVATWNLWQPTDPVHQLIKRSIDQTPTG